MKKFGVLAFLALLSGCFQAYSEDEELRTVPVTNNPTIVPNHGSSPIPGMGGLTPY